MREGFMETLTVALDERSYPIYIGEDLLGQLSLFQPHITGKQVCIVTNTTLESLYLQTLQQTLSDYDVTSVVLPDGEAFKSLEVLTRILDRKSTRLNSSHVRISYAVFCLKKKKN